MHRDVEIAHALAADAHRDDAYGRHPYSVHLDDCDAILAEFGIVDPVITAAMRIHDLFEDHREVWPPERALAAGLSEAVVAVALRVTDDGATRKDRKRATYPKIAGDPRAVVVKLVDRLANVRRSAREDAKKLAMYRGEHAEFRAALDIPYVRDSEHGATVAALWTALERDLGVT